MSNSNAPLFIGFRLLNTPEPMVAFICDDCLKPHLHPDNGSALQRFASNCVEPERSTDAYDLLIVGAVPGRRDLPFPVEDDEIVELQGLLACVPR